MRYPNLQTENKLRQGGFKFIAGLDEAGRGSWAGPIVAGAVILNPKKRITGLRDSKLLTALSRQRLYEEITKTALAWAVGKVSHDIIDRQGIGRANLLAMELALKNLAIKPDHLLIDAIKLNFKNLPAISIIDGDYKIASIAAASIIAKVSRDRLMAELHKKYPAYGFARHKGYGTAHHYRIICRRGLCRIHRQSFEPMKSLLKI